MKTYKISHKKKGYALNSLQPHRPADDRPADDLAAALDILRSDLRAAGLDIDPLTNQLYLYVTPTNNTLDR